MKSVGKWGIVILLVSIAAGFYAALQFGEKSPIYASGELILADELTPAAIGIRTVYITVFDAESKMPMPFGAMRQRLKEDPSGTFLSFRITKEKLQQMNPAAPAPKTMRIKARLDIDGLGGMDQPGDISGTVSPVEFGTTNLRITLDNRVEAKS